MKVVARESRHFFLAFAWSFRKKCLSLQAKSISSMMKVANPIYDIVFKYLLEDERIASDAKIRHDMNVEDEFFSVIEKRDTDLMLKDKKIAEQITQIAEKNSQIAEKNSQIAEQSNQIAEQNTQIAVQSNQIAEQNTQIAEQWSTICTSVKMLHSAGMSAESIAMNLNLDLEKVNQIIKDK